MYSYTEDTVFYHVCQMSLARATTHACATQSCRPSLFAGLTLKCQKLRTRPALCCRACCSRRLKRMILATEGGTCDVPSARGDQVPGNDGVSLTAVISGAKSEIDWGPLHRRFITLWHRPEHHHKTSSQYHLLYTGKVLTKVKIPCTGVFSCCND